MFEKVLSKNESESLAVLGKSELLADVYMAGGTALALQIGYRFSYDFDLFSLEKFDNAKIRKKIVKDSWKIGKVYKDEDG
jgi:hypothetical protein